MNTHPTGARITFIGGREHGHELLRKLIGNGERIEHVYALEEDEHECVRFDRRIASLATSAGVMSTVRKRLSRADVADIIASHPDLILVFGWRTILPPELVRAPRLGCFGVHDSLLPRYRGFAPTNWAVINREPETGVTLWRLNEDVDAGAIIAQRRIAIDADDTAAAVYARVVADSVALVLEYLPRIVDGTAKAAPQDDAGATFGCARTPEDGMIDWSRSAEEIAALVRALARPYPGAFTYLNGEKLTVWAAHAIDPSPTYEGRIIGRVARLHAGMGVEVLCGSGSLLLEEVEFAGAAAERADRVIRSVRATLGISQVDLLRRVAALESEVSMLRRALEARPEVEVPV